MIRADRNSHMSEFMTMAAFEQKRPRKAFLKGLELLPPPWAARLGPRARQGAQHSPAGTIPRRDQEINLFPHFSFPSLWQVSPAAHWQRPRDNSPSFCQGRLELQHSPPETDCVLKHTYQLVLALNRGNGLSLCDHVQDLSETCGDLKLRTGELSLIILT